MAELENFQTKAAISRNCTITTFYNDFFHEPASLLFKLHQKLDKAVCDCYGWKYSDKKSYKEEIFNLNADMTKQR